MDQGRSDRGRHGQRQQRRCEPRIPAARTTTTGRTRLRSTGPCASSKNLSPGDWTAETKILNTDVDAGRFAGMLIEADSNHFIRSDWDGDGHNVALYVGVLNGGASFAPKHNRPVGNQAVQWQRIAKVGTTYTVSTSTDGASWTWRAQFTWTPTPKRIGVDVGNSVGTPVQRAVRLHRPPSVFAGRMTEAVVLCDRQVSTEAVNR